MAQVGPGVGVYGALNHVVNWSPLKRNKGGTKSRPCEGKPMVFIGPDDEAVFLVEGGYLRGGNRLTSHNGRCGRFLLSFINHKL